MFEFLILIVGGFVCFFVLIAAFAARYKRCPSDKILVVYGKVGGNNLSARCYHGGAAFIWPIIQDYQYLDLTPIPIDIKLEGALSQQNIRVNTPSTFMVGISTEPGVMENAAERMLGLTMEDVRLLARDIIFGQMRVVIATMPIEEINADRDKLILNISSGVEVELKKVGLRLINVNIQDITDESGYIDALGKEAAARAINDAKIKVAQQERDGDIGSAEAQRDQRIQVAEANARATEGENLSMVEVAQSNSARREREAEAERTASAAEKVKQAQTLQEAYSAEKLAEEERATREKASMYANIVVPAEVEKKKIETIAEADAERTRRLQKGEADGSYSVMEAEARGKLAIMQAEAQGQQEILSKKADGLERIVAASGGTPEQAALLLLTEQLPEIVAEQVKAIANLKIDSVTVWDGGSGKDGKSSTADFASSLIKSLPPLHELTRNAGIELPEFLGKLTADPTKAAKPAESLKKKALTTPAVTKKPESKPEDRQNSIRKWLSDNRELLASFDLNDNNQIDETEIDAAVETALNWAEEANTSTTSNWLYAEDGKALGPKTWSEIKHHSQNNKAMFVSLNDGASWLPVAAIKLAMKDLKS